MKFRQHLDPKLTNIFTNKQLKAIYGNPFSSYPNAASSGWSTWTSEQLTAMLPLQCSNWIILHPSSNRACHLQEQLESSLLLSGLYEERLEMAMYNRTELSE